MDLKNLVSAVAALAVGALGGLAVSQRGRIRSLEAAVVGVSRRARDAADELAQWRLADSAAAASGSAALRAELADRVHFDVNQWQMRPTDAEILDEKVAILSANPGTRIRIIGHCDERGGEIYNLALGRRRADAARQYLLHHGIAASRIETVSAGKGQPVDRRHDESAWAKNRRDEFQIIGDGNSLNSGP